MKLHTVTMVLSLLMILSSCGIAPVPIEYNVDQCHACKMIIADSRFGSELITTKGKVYKYDAIECLVPDLVKNGEDHYKFALVTDFTQPPTLTDARSATYLISENLPSPMGGFLSAYGNEADAVKALENYGGKLYNWDELKKYDLFAYLE